MFTKADLILLSFAWEKPWHEYALVWSHNIQWKDTKARGTRHDDNQHNTAQENDTQHYDTEDNSAQFNLSRQNRT